MNLVDLTGRSCVITGAASGIGRAAAVLFAELGAVVTAADLDGARLEWLAAETGVATVVGDVSDEADSRRIVAAAVERGGRLDVLVANAGIIPLADVTQTSVSDWERVMSVDGLGMFLSCKHAIEQMARQGGPGAVVCVSSISGLAGQARQAAYGPAKFVATGLTMHLAVEWAGRGIRVNAVAPGTIRTERVMSLMDEPGGAEYLEGVAARHPVGRLGEPAEVARAIAFLASDAASFITGAILPVDGGYLAQ